MNENRNGSRTKQKFWRTIEEKSSSLTPAWETPEFEKSPQEILEEAKGQGFSRRTFLKFMGASAVMVGAACRRPTEQIVPAVVQTPEYIPGEALFYSTVSPDGTGLIVRTREGRPVKIAGNPEHPIGEGGVSAYEVASIMDLYDPDRLRRAALITDGKKKYVDESEIVDEASSKIQEGSYAILSGPINSPSSRALIHAFLKKFPGGRLMELRQDPTLRQIAEGQRLCYGESVVPTYNFDKANYILSIDADFLGSMILPAYFSANFAKGRDVRNGGKQMSRLVAIESMMSVTGSNADERIPVRPGDQVSVALAIASQIVVKLGRSSFAGNSAVTGVLSRYLPEKVAPALGISEEAIAKIAEDLWSNRGASLVIGGSPLAANGNNASLQIVVNLLNSILENDGKSINHEYPIQLSSGASDAEMQSFIGDLHSGKIKTLIVAGANPVFHLPESLPVKESLGKVEYILSINDRIDETARLANAILPSSHYLESWSDSEPIKGLLSVGQPVIRPLYETKSLEDRLIQLAGGSIDGHESFYSFLKSRWSSFKGSRKFWNSVLMQGHYSPSRKEIKRDVRSRGFNQGVLQRLPSAPDQTGLKLGFYYAIPVRDGSGANNAYRQELPDPITKIVWSNAAAILPETARKLKLEEGSLVDINTQSGTIRIPVHLQPGLHPDAILIALGYGRSEAGKTANGVGTSVMNMVNSGNDSFIYSGISAEIKATGKSKKLAGTQLVYRNGFNTEDRAFFAPGTLPNAPYGGSSDYDRPILLETTLAEYQKDAAGVRKKLIKYPKNADIMKKWDYRGMRWHMVIDLNLCTGCSACVTSCDLENNVPMVGPDEVATGREMHWLKIDRYYSGDEENPEVAHQPMMCQHCENAPCETVCPVAATQHNNEGLNVMAYNRCVGTRYCANNCPFKVRRFNWFENWDYMEGLRRKLRDPAQLGLNPDVTVRRRGVMEKCTFCIQRIANARHEMRTRGEKILQDGTFVTACQEVCPTSAISFGNINDQNSRVYRLTTEEKRSYKVLDFLNVNPSVTYLAKIRNKG
jgi:molybdopterin-containing oxidoreductase family iron-sulfur binding subunit